MKLPAEPDGDQRNQRRQRLDIEDFARRGGCAKKPGDQHAQQEKHFELKTGGAKVEPVKQAGGQKTVVEALIGGEHLGVARKVRLQPERPVTGRSVPRHHFQPDDVAVDQRNQRNQTISNHFKALLWAH